MKTHGYASLKPHGRMPALPKWHRKEFADMLEALWNGCISA